MVKHVPRSNLLSRFRSDESGGIIALFSVMAPVILGVVGLSIEIGRGYYLNNDLQELADAAALAGAAELDGQPDAITRAIDRATNLLSNDPRWSNVVYTGAQIQTPTFYSAISLGGDTTTIVPAEAS